MGRNLRCQPALFEEAPGVFPGTRYQGSKAKLVDWIWDLIQDLDFQTCLDVFGGTGAVAFRLKQAGKQVTYNDLLRFNYCLGKALIENSNVCLGPETVDWILRRHSEIEYPSFIVDTFHDIYFTDAENAWLDQTVTNIRQLKNPYQFALAFFALCQACIIKRPYNLFHRKNLYLRFAEVERSFGNKTTWDRPFEEWFCDFVQEANNAVFDNGSKNLALNYDAMKVPGEYNMVYIDPPYISAQGTTTDYWELYHFLEGLTIYDEWNQHLDPGSKHRRLKPRKSDWCDKQRIPTAFDRLFQRFEKSIIVVSYRSDGIPSETELTAMLKKYKRNVRIEHFGKYKYVLSKNADSKEIVIIGK